MKLRAALRTFSRDRAGASAVEFALIIGPFLVLVFGVFEFGRWYWTQNAIQQAAISGARCMGIGQNECSSDGAPNADRTSAYVREVARSWLIPLAVENIHVNGAATCSDSLHLSEVAFAQVRIDYEFRTVIPRMIVALAGTSLGAQSCFPSGSR